MGEQLEGLEELYAAVLDLKVSFDRKAKSWYVRALARVLLGPRRLSERHWLVPGGLPGDRYEFYNVWLSRDGKYRCDCYGRTFGERRGREVCTHVAAVMLARRWEEIATASESGAPPWPDPRQLVLERRKSLQREQLRDRVDRR